MLTPSYSQHHGVEYRVLICLDDEAVQIGCAAEGCGPPRRDEVGEIVRQCDAPPLDVLALKMPHLNIPT